MNFRKSPHSTSLLAAASLVAVAWSSAATAQNVPADNTIIVVGITKQAAAIQDTPIAITAFSDQKLVEQGIQKLDEIATFTPGFNIRGAGNNPTSLTLAMRGQIQVDTLATLEPSVGIYLDGVYIARSYGLNFDLVDIANVQVLKGPQGTLFGRNTSAGAVLIQTADPVYDEISGRVKLSYGRYNEHTGEAVLNLGLSDRAAIRGAIYYTKRDGYQKDLSTGRMWEGHETVSGRVKVGLKPTDNLEVILSGDWYDTNIDGPARSNLFFNAPAAFGPLKPIVDGMVAQEREVQMSDRGMRVGVTPTDGMANVDPNGPSTSAKTQTYIARVNLDTEIGLLSWINSYRNVNSTSMVDLDGSDFHAHLTRMGTGLKQYSSELQWTGSAFEDKLDYAFGATYFRETGYEFSMTSLFGGTFPVSPSIPAEFQGKMEWSRFYGEIDNNSYGIYSQLHYKLTDALGITGGIRYSVDDKGLTSQNGNVADNIPTAYVNCAPASLPVPCRRPENNAAFSNISYTAGVDYQVAPDILFYAKYSKGYRAGAMQLRSLTFADATPALPEIVREQEVGLKTTFFNGRATFNIAGYHNKVKNAQRTPVVAPNGNSQTVIENADTETWGVEADASVQVADGFTLFASGALTDPKYTKYDGIGVSGPEGSQILQMVDKKDYRLIGIVKQQFSVGANLKQDLGGVGLDANIVYAWQGRMPQVDTPFSQFASTGVGGLGLTPAQADELNKYVESGPLGILNARIALSFGPQKNYEVSLWGRNLTNDIEQQYTLLLSNIYVGTSYNEPRTFGVSVGLKF